jgi:hypothetical protein
LSGIETCQQMVSAALGRLVPAGLLTVALTLMGAGGAAAVSVPVKVGSPLSSGPPSIAVESSGAAVIAWANQQELGGGPDFVQYCVIPVGASACSQAGSLTPAGGTNHVDGVQVLRDGGTLVILADVFGTPFSAVGRFEPEQEWQSTDGGATWTLVDGGVSVSSGILNADTVPVSGVILPGTGELGYGWDTAGPAGPTFNAFPLSGAPECSESSCAAGFSSLEPSTNPDQLGNEPGEFASISSGPNGGVMGVFETVFTNGPLGCAQDFGIAFVYGSGNQSPSNNYNISPGQPNTAWRIPIAQADCDIQYAGVGGGPSGFGILADELSGQTIYHRFDAATDKFDTPPVVIAHKDEQQASVSQDGAGNIYGTYLLGGAGGPVTLSYSADGGKSWSSGRLDSDSDSGVASLNSAVDATGQGWVTWIDNGSVFAQPFKAADAIEPAAVGGGATTNGQTITLNVSCASFPCTITIVLSAPGTVHVHASSASIARSKSKQGKHRSVTLGSGKFTIKSKGSHKLAVKLSTAGRKFIRSHKGRVKIAAKVSELHGKVTTRTLELKIPKRHRKKK